MMSLDRAKVQLIFCVTVVTFLFVLAFYYAVESALQLFASAISMPVISGSGEATKPLLIV